MNQRCAVVDQDEKKDVVESDQSGRKDGSDWEHV